MEDWLKENMQTIMVIIGVASAVGVVVVFGAYFMVKRKLSKDKESS